MPDPDGWAGRLAERVVTARTLAQYGDPGPARTRADWIVARLLPGSHVSEVVRDGPVVGVAWLGHEGDTTDVYDAGSTTPPTARRCGRRCSTGPGPGRRSSSGPAWSPERRPARDGRRRGFTLMATNLRLDLDGPLPEPGDVRVEPMSEAEFDASSPGPSGSTPSSGSGRASPASGPSAPRASSWPSCCRPGGTVPAIAS